MRVIAYADKRGEVRGNQKALAEAESLGKAIVETLRMLQMGSREVR